MLHHLLFLLLLAHQILVVRVQASSKPNKVCWGAFYVAGAAWASPVAVAGADPAVAGGIPAVAGADAAVADGDPAGWCPSLG